MEINSINNEYGIFKAQILEKNQVIKKYQQEISVLIEDYQIEEAERIKAIRDNNAEKESQANRNIEIIRKKILEIEAKIEIEKIEIEDLKQRIDELLNLLFSDSTMQENALNVLEEQYISKIETLTNRKQKLEKEQRKVRKIREILQSNPLIGKQMKKIINASIELKRINFVIKNLENNGLLSKKEKSNIELLHESNNEREKQECIRNDSQESIKNNLSIAEYELIVEKIEEMKQISIEQVNKINVNRIIEKQLKSIENEIKQLEKCIENNKRELAIVQQKNEKNTKKSKVKSRWEEKREDFLRKMDYEIVHEGVKLIKSQIREERETKEKTR